MYTFLAIFKYSYGDAAAAATVLFFKGIYIQFEFFIQIFVFHVIGTKFVELFNEKREKNK